MTEGSNLPLQHRSCPQRNVFEKTERELLIIILFDTEMKKFIKICKAILPRFFSSNTLALVISWVTNCVFSYVCKFEVTCNQALHMRL